MKSLRTNIAVALGLLFIVLASTAGCGSDNSTRPSASSGGSPASKATGGSSASGMHASAGSSASGSSGAAQGGTGGAPSSQDAGSVHDAGTVHDASTTRDAGTMPHALRVTELYLRDPHFYLNGVDITDMPFLGQSVNGSLIQNGFTMDYDGDGFVDVSFLLVFDALDPLAAHAQLQLIDGNCKLADPTQCAAKAAPSAMWTIDNKMTGSCLDPIAGTTSSFTPAVSTPSGPCFVTDSASDFTVTLGGIAIPLTAAKIAASYQGNPPSALMTGLISGFVTKQKAMQATLPDYLGPPLAGTPLSDYLDSKEADMAESPNQQDGYWLYLNFVAKPVTYTPK